MAICALKKSTLCCCVVNHHEALSSIHDFPLVHLHLTSQYQTVNMVPSPKLLTHYDIVFCCSVCQATPSEVYRDLARDGLKVGQRNDTSALLWLGECGHVVCSKHFEGSGKFERAFQIIHQTANFVQEFRFILNMRNHERHALFARLRATTLHPENYIG